MKKVIFIDRDGTLIHEPKDTEQIDSLEKLSFLPGVFKWLGKICEELDFELAMVTNQDGLGTSSFPEDNFWPAHQKMLDFLEAEGINFQQIHIDKSFEHEGKATRKPNTGMLQKYFDGSYDLKNSWVIGDRGTDITLAHNLGAKGIFITINHPQPNHLKENDLVVDTWEEIYMHLKLPPRKATVLRNTHETQIEIQLNLDGKGICQLSTGLGFFDHMLEQLGKHSGSDLSIQVQGDLHIDEHHTIEDTALALGEAFAMAIGDKKGISRYGYLLPMDDCLAQAAIDFSGRPWLVWDAPFHREKIGDMPTEMFMHFWKSFSDSAKCNLNIQAHGENEHHKIEAIFKAVAKSIKMAVQRDPKNLVIPSTKGVL